MTNKYDPERALRNENKRLVSVGRELDMALQAVLSYEDALPLHIRLQIEKARTQAQPLIWPGLPR